MAKNDVITVSKCKFKTNLREMMLIFFVNMHKYDDKTVFCIDFWGHFVYIYSMKTWTAGGGCKGSLTPEQNPNAVLC